MFAALYNKENSSPLVVLKGKQDKIETIIKHVGRRTHEFHLARVERIFQIYYQA